MVQASIHEQLPTIMPELMSILHDPARHHIGSRELFSYHCLNLITHVFHVSTVGDSLLVEVSFGPQAWVIQQSVRLSINATLFSLVAELYVAS